MKLSLNAHFLPSMSFSANTSKLHPRLTKQIGLFLVTKTTPYHSLKHSLVLVLPNLGYLHGLPTSLTEAS
jgi:hypothetical protein